MGESALRQPRWKNAVQSANDLTKDYSAPPIPVLEIAENSGVDVVFADFAEFNDDVAGFCDFNGAKLYVNANDYRNRQTFTIAHELGHWILHRDLFKDNPEEYPILMRYQAPDNNNPYEKEANFFAANLLVPTRLLVPVKELPPIRLAEIFSVSRIMMEHRLKNV